MTFAIPSDLNLDILITDMEVITEYVADANFTRLKEDRGLRRGVTHVTCYCWKAQQSDD